MINKLSKSYYIDSSYIPSMREIKTSKLGYEPSNTTILIDKMIKNIHVFREEYEGQRKPKFLNQPKRQTVVENLTSS
jgi:hypothetical protein